jgi:hypothetical protein
LKSSQIRLLHIKLGVYKEGSEIVLQQFLLQVLHEGLAKNLKYFKFDDGPLFKVLREPIRLIKETLPAGYIHDTFLFSEKAFGWIGGT